MSDINTDLAKLQEKKIEAYGLSESFCRLQRDDPVGDLRYHWSRRSAEVLRCGTYIKFGELKGTGDTKLVDANFCRQRLCPQCLYRRSLKVYSTICQIMDIVDSWDRDYQYLFLTLTVRNVSGCQLRDCLSNMSSAWNLMINGRRGWKKIVKGCIKTIEVTINPDDGSYHPHYHVILAVPAEYGKRACGLYRTTEDWAKEWQDCLLLDYRPHCKVNLISNLSAGVKETSHYSAKPAEFLYGSDISEIDRRVADLQKALHGKRLLSYTGCFKSAAREICFVEAREEMNLWDELDALNRDDVYCCFFTYHWSFGANLYFSSNGG